MNTSYSDTNYGCDQIHISQLNLIHPYILAVRRLASPPCVRFIPLTLMKEGLTSDYTESFMTVSLMS